MTQKRSSYLIRCNPVSVVRDTDQGDPAVLYLDRNCICTGVDRILDKLFYDRGRTFYDLACSDLIYGFLTKYSDLVHMLPPLSACPTTCFSAYSANGRSY